jgi:3-deoxy-manno-octulosonate cytidylyltransferase (CMP-KDO synthetase)
MHPIILIPARMASTRLPNKPMADIGGLPMIVQVWKRAVESGVGQVVVATDHTDIRDAVEMAGGKAVMTDTEHPSGSDRIYQALTEVDPERVHDVVINLQGDIPTMEPRLIQDVTLPLLDPDVDIATLACRIDNDADRLNPNVVKVAIGQSTRNETTATQTFIGHNEFNFDSPVLSLASTGGPRIGRALYFSRATIPHGEGPTYHHIGIYAYRRKALEAFVKLPPSPLEQQEKLEQLRALENGMRIDVAVVNTVPLGVDTREQLEEARKVLGSRG